MSPGAEEAEEVASTQGEISVTLPAEEAGARSPSGLLSSPNGKAQAPKAQAETASSGTTASEFVSVLGSKISELEKVMAGGTQMEREASKARKKQLREVSKYVADKNYSAEERVSFLMTRYTTMVSDSMKMERHYHEVQRDLEVATRERDKVQTELKKANTLKDKLEELCRVLQRENKEVLEEAKRRSEEDVKQRQALQHKFTNAINDVNVKMDGQQEERNKQIAENDLLRGKLNDVLEQFEQFSQMLNKKDLEVQLANAKFEQQQQINQQLTMKADLLMEQNEQLVKLQQDSSKELDGFVLLKDQNVALLEANKELKQQLEHYYTKFADFQGTLTKSNQMFSNLKKELEGHHKVRAKLMKEKDELMRRCDQSDAMVAKLSRQRNTLNKQVASLGGEPMEGGGEEDEVKKLRAQKERLEGLCRALQSQLAAARTGSGATDKSSSSDKEASCASSGTADRVGEEGQEQAEGGADAAARQGQDPPTDGAGPPEAAQDEGEGKVEGGDPKATEEGTSLVDSLPADLD